MHVFHGFLNFVDGGVDLLVHLAVCFRRDLLEDLVRGVDGVFDFTPVFVDESGDGVVSLLNSADDFGEEVLDLPTLTGGGGGHAFHGGAPYSRLVHLYEVCF